MNTNWAQRFLPRLEDRTGYRETQIPCVFIRILSIRITKLKEAKKYPESYIGSRSRITSTKVFLHTSTNVFLPCGVKKENIGFCNQHLCKHHVKDNSKDYIAEDDIEIIEVVAFILQDALIGEYKKLSKNYIKLKMYV